MFPRLGQTQRYTPVSPIDEDYNCIAFAAGDTENWWQPSVPFPGGWFWPDGAPHANTLEAYVAAFVTLGYVECDSGDLEPGVEKVALYVGSSGEPTHASRQRPDGSWVSKLGKSYDIVHEDVDGVGGDRYGEVATFLGRTIP